jgi:hypothetical protein
MSDWLMASGCIENLTTEESAWWSDQEFDCANIEEHDGGEHLVFDSLPLDDEVDLLQESFKRFRPNDCVTITWACECGRYFGGGACLIAADTDLWNHVADWSDEQAEKYRLAKKDEQK